MVETLTDTPVLKKTVPIAESKVTERYQTTLPAAVRKALGLRKHDRLAYEIDADGSVRLRRVEESVDPVLEKFAAFIARDIEQNPENAKPVSVDLVERAKALIEGMDSDLDAPLEEDE